MPLYASIQLRQLIAGFSHGGDHLPAIGGILPREFQANAAVGAGDENVRHGTSTLARRGVP
jgi:hypothetical protein